MRILAKITANLILLLIGTHAALAQQAQSNFSQPGNPPGNEAPFPPVEMESNYGNGQSMLPPQYPAEQGYGYAPQQSRPAPKPNPQAAAKVFQWFLKYDEIRRRAQMNPIEKQQADALLARGFGLFMPAQDKAAARALLGDLINRYSLAAQSIRAMPSLPETKVLHDDYLGYFDNAKQLFVDYLKVQDNLFAVDNNGQSIAKQLIQRKMLLENIERSCKETDSQMRQAYGIAAYQY